MVVFWGFGQKKFGSGLGLAGFGKGWVGKGLGKMKRETERSIMMSCFGILGGGIGKLPHLWRFFLRVRFLMHDYYDYY